MNLSTQVKPISYLKSHAAEIALTLADTREPMLITQNGEARLVVMDVASYESQAQTMALLKILAMGQHEIDQGRTHDASSVLAELAQDSDKF